ncbi:MAG: hypothetical protein FJZ12_02670 [Candidatus Omnitrophica bacterium]|nr:hypothetical protein [Candidatus Omnitrophota bacterium]
MNKKALTLLEILVSVIILALVVTGLAAVFVSGKRYIQHSRLRMTGGEIGKLFLDPLQNFVRQDTWLNNPLGNSSMTAGLPNPPTGSSFSREYNINPDFLGSSSDTSKPNLTKVKTTINWSE